MVKGMALSIAACALGFSACALAQDAATRAAQAYPSKPLRFIAPNPPGGPTDILARLVGQKPLAKSKPGQLNYAGLGRGHGRAVVKSIAVQLD
jgi:tripartite-type tricarboxylate transporter receptor subunit TctC